MDLILSQIASLNEPQQTAVKSDARCLLVLAGAGSGKTRVLTQRVAWLIESGQATPWGVMAVTFTNKAAREMRQRVEELLPQSPRGMWVGTFHGLAHRLLKTHAAIAGLPEQFQVLDSDDQLRLIKRVMADLEIDKDMLDPRQTQGFINNNKDEGIRAGILQRSADPQTEMKRRVYQVYEQRCKANGLVDFGELLLGAHELLRDNDYLLKRYQQQFQHVLVDEFQDTNTIQYAWLRLLCGDKLRLTVVGDDDQSIYGWRGAKIENIQRLQDDFPATEVVRLEQNYRSTANILNAANAVITHNSNRMGKELWTQGEPGDPIQLFQAFNEQEEGQYIADQIQGLIEGGTNADDIALLYRSNAQSRVLEEALIQHKIPYRIYGGVRFYDREEVRHVISYLRLVANRRDDTAFERVINVPARGVGARSVDRIRVQARTEGCSMWEAASQLVELQSFKGKAAAGIADFLMLIEDFTQALADDTVLSDVCKMVVQTTGLENHYDKEGRDKAQTRKENMMEVVNASKTFEKAESDLEPLDHFLSEASLDAGEAQADVAEPCVHLMTLHASKGLEFEHVYLTGLEENLFPHRMSSDTLAGLEEERRLCYVGITRARKHLTISHAEIRRVFGQEMRNQASRFISELPEELVNKVRSGFKVQTSQQANRYGSRPKAASSWSAVPEDTGFQLNSRVKHPMFGEGVVIAARGQGANASVMVAFESEGTKELMVQYAKLEVL